MSEGRIYDDIWPLNVAGRYCCDMTMFAKDQLDERYPEGWEANSHMLLMTHEGSPYLGKWHVDGPPYKDDSILMICLAGHDELEYYTTPYISYQSTMNPGDIALFPVTTEHRGRCSTYRITYHCRVGPKGKIMPESPRDQLPVMSLRRFFGRTWRTLRYYVRQGF